MGIKYCKSCKKPMRPADTHCKTCGKEYKNSPIIIIGAVVILLAIIGIAAYIFGGKAESNAAEPAVTNSEPEAAPVASNWKYESSTDPINNVQTHAATVQASDYDTKAKVNSEFTIACQNRGDYLNVVISATYPIKTDSFSSDGPMARYYMKVDQGEPLSGVARAASNNTVIVLNQFQSKDVLDQLKADSKVIFQMSSVKDTLLTYEADLNGATAVIEKLKKDCAPKNETKQ